MEYGELIICHLDFLINDFGEFDDAVFKCFERPNELIFRILSMDIINLDEVA
jgi:hypothetical protein